MRFEKLFLYLSNNVKHALSIVMLIAVLTRVVWIFAVSPSVPNALGGSKVNWNEDKEINSNWLKIDMPYGTPGTTVSPDFNQCYEPGARSILKGKGFLDIEGRVTAYVPPLYSVYIAIIYSIFGYSITILRIIQVLLDVISVILVFRISTRFLDERFSIYAATIYAIHPLIIYQTGLLLPDFLFTVLLLFFLDLLLMGIDNKKFLTLFAAGIVLGFSTLARANMLFFPLFLLFVFILNSAFKLSVRRFVPLFIGFLLVVTFWTARNYYHFNQFVPISSIIYRTADGVNPDMKSGASGLVNRKIDEFVNQPFSTVGKYLDKSVKIWYYTNTGIFSQYIMYVQIPLVFIMYLSALLLVKLNKKSAILYSVMIYYPLTVIFFSQNPLVRYTVPLIPIIIIMDLVFAKYLFNKYQGRNQK